MSRAPLLLAPLLLLAGAAPAAAPFSSITLAKTGTCPGQINFVIAGATPNANVVIVYGNAGSSTYGGNPCNGMFIPLANANLGTILSSDAGGNATFSILVTAGACGKSVAAINVGTCTASNTVIV